MKQQIEQYINSITVDKVWGLNNQLEYTETCRLQFYGDGQGDFEEMSYNTTDECLKKYISECQEQISLAKAELKSRKS